MINVSILANFNLPNGNEVFLISEVLFMSEAVVSRLHQVREMFVTIKYYSVHTHMRVRRCNYRKCLKYIRITAHQTQFSYRQVLEIRCARITSKHFEVSISLALYTQFRTSDLPVVIHVSFSKGSQIEKY